MCGTKEWRLKMRKVYWCSQVVGVADEEGQVAVIQQ